MKALFLFLCSLFVFQEITAQRAVVANVKENIAYVGLQNPIMVMAEGYKCDQLEVSTNNGTILKTEEPCIYTFIPKSKGRSTIYIRSKAGRKTFADSLEFRTILVPGPKLEIETFLEFDPTSSDRIYHKRKGHLGINLTSNNFHYDVRYRCKEYSVSIRRGANLIFERKNVEGFQFKKIQDGLQKVEVGDKILIYGIIYRGPDNLDRELSSVEFTVAE